MNIKEKMRPIGIIDSAAPIKEVSSMTENNVPDSFLVSEDNHLIGILTDADLLIKVSKDDLESNEIKIKDVMSSPVITIESNSTIEDAIKIMNKYSIKKLPVIENGRPVGILFGEDILELDEEQWKEIVFKQTIEEIYKLLLREPGIDCVSALNIVRNIDKFSDMNKKIDFDLFIFQEGVVLVAYNYFKENPDKKLKESIEYIRKNFDLLLDKYSDIEAQFLGNVSNYS